MDVNIFRGRNIYEIAGYPTVYWPEHPVSFAWGHTYIHRIVAYDEWGEEVFDRVVHHIDEDVWNWDIDNLKLVTSWEHKRIHNPEFGRFESECEECGSWFERKNSERGPFCSLSCSYQAREKIDWPEDSVLERMVWEQPVTKIAEQLGVSDKAVSKRCNKRDIETPGRGYWQKKRARKI